MFCIRLDQAQQGVAPSQFDQGKVRRECVRSLDDMSAVITSLTAELGNAGYPAKDVFAAQLSLEEAIANAIKHGHQRDTTKPVWVNYYGDEKGVVFQVEDQGEGFDPSAVPDPRLPENLERASGRGLLLMRSYMNGVCHNERGNCVCFCKLRPLPVE